MTRFPRRFSLATAGLAAGVASLAAQGAAQQPPRAVRRDIPMTNAIRHAFAAGTRDSTGRPTAAYWQLKTDYSIDVRLDPPTSRLYGSEVITVTNNSPDTLTSVALHLAMNHFRFGTPRAAPWAPSEETDGTIITKLAVDGMNGAIEPPAGAAAAGGRGGRGGRGGPAMPAQPTLMDGHSTLARIALARPILPHAAAKIAIDWNARVPGAEGNYRHRMDQRWADTLYQPTQWFPRVAVYDDLRGWDPELYLGPSEFYNEFGRYDVRITVPAGWIVSGTGELVNPEDVLTPAARAQLAKVTQTDGITTIVGPDQVGPGQATVKPASGDRLTWHKVAENVNDFAWATAKKYVWEATRANIPGKGYVPVHMVFTPGHANLYANAGPLAAHALEFYSKLWYPYSFPQLTLQDGPSAGMEYPMVINANQGAADHETFHQWAPMTTSNNETWYGWMDEGFNQYANILSGADRNGVAPNLNGQGQSYGRTSGNESEPPMMWNANYAGPNFYSFVTYSKMPLLLSSLGGVVGDSAVQRANSEWATAWRYKHPSPWDWMFFMNNALKARAGGDLGWFFYYWLFTTESVDGSIANVKTAAGKTTVTVKQAGQMPSPVVLKVAFASSGPAIKPMKNARMVDANTAIVTWPVDVWFGGARSYDAVLDFGGRAIESVTLDPCGRFPDADTSDNVWPRSAAPATLAGGRGGGRGGRGQAVPKPAGCE
ncbi:MAG TPA: M1 family metallopeptidase [Gemmatimonadaceae bacterium]|nr:M1 family metallopeptidase [Gemmatimonadaceae bacterium]